MFVGVNAEGNEMLTITTLNTDGQLESKKGIVAERVIILKEDENTWWSCE